jgi:hypothetical protein
MRKKRAFPDGLANGRSRPFADLPDPPGTGTKRQKAAVGGTRQTRQNRTLLGGGANGVGDRNGERSQIGWRLTKHTIILLVSSTAIGIARPPVSLIFLL